ncbi:hypothetical protein N9W17_01490 [Jannaschia sp.]|nr:hypothetical protein [Jannaschia sp.]
MDQPIDIIRPLRTDLKAVGKRIQTLERELARKEKALADAAALMILRKEADAIWGPEGGEDV